MRSLIKRIDELSDKKRTAIEVKCTVISVVCIVIAVVTTYLNLTK